MARDNGISVAASVRNTARLVDGNEVMGMKCCNGNSNEGMDMRIGNENSFVWCAWLKNGIER